MCSQAVDPARPPHDHVHQQTYGLQKPYSKGVRWAREELNLRPLPCQIQRAVSSCSSDTQQTVEERSKTAGDSGQEHRQALTIRPALAVVLSVPASAICCPAAARAGLISAFPDLLDGRRCRGFKVPKAPIGGFIVSAPMGSGLVKGREGIGPPVRPGGWLACGGADRQGRRPGRGFGVGSHAPIRAPEGGVRMTVSPDPGCSVRSTAVLQTHAETRARPVLAFSGAGAVSSWVRMWKERASSRRAIAVVAMWVPRRRASWA
jgi:hypothetical protein